MKDKKSLKTMDLDDLEADYDKSMLNEEAEEIIESVNVNDLDLPQKVVTAPKKKINKAIEKFDPAMHAQRKKLNSMKGDKLLKHLTQKFRFDRAKTRMWVVALIVQVCVVGYFFEELPNPLSKNGNEFFDIGGSLLIGVLDMVVVTLHRTWPFVAFAILFTVPIKVLTPTMIEIFYDGITIPHEVFPLGAYMRRRVVWRQIKIVKFKTKRQVPIMQLYNKRKELLGEVRLDVDDVGTMYECIDMYAPKEHPIRILFENKKS